MVFFRIVVVELELIQTPVSKDVEIYLEEDTFCLLCFVCLNKQFQSATQLW